MKSRAARVQQVPPKPILIPSDSEVPVEAAVPPVVLSTVTKGIHTTEKEADSARFLCLLIYGIWVSVLFTSWMTLLVYPFTDDSIVYLDSAKHFLEGKGFVHAPYGPEPVDQNSQALDIFPIGFPFLVSIISFLGFPLDATILAVPRICWALVPLVVAWSIKPVTSNMVAIISGVLAGISPGVVMFGYRAMSDVPFFLFVALSVGFLVRYVRYAPSSVSRLLISGFFAGAAYGLRNAGVAILLAVPLAFLFRRFVEQPRHQRALLDATFWVGGGLPLLVSVWVRNFLEFGALNTYSGCSPTSARQMLCKQ